MKSTTDAIRDRLVAARDLRAQCGKDIARLEAELRGAEHRVANLQAAAMQAQAQAVAGGWAETGYSASGTISFLAYAELLPVLSRVLPEHLNPVEAPPRTLRVNLDKMRKLKISRPDVYDLLAEQVRYPAQANPVIF